MSDGVARLRMFAGPNGSGKTTIKQGLSKPGSWFGLYFNPDDLEAAIARTGLFSLAQLGLAATTAEVRGHFASSPLLQRAGLAESAATISCRDDEVDFSGIRFTAYHASVLSDFLRRRALAAARSFSFETVMSSEDKVALLGEARQAGFRTYLYYVATEAPEINVQRVRNRVAEGGHDVPEDKIVSRYHRSLALLPGAIRFSHRAYLFDTSEESSLYFAEVTDGSRIEFKSSEVPNWFAPFAGQFEVS